LEQHIVTDEQLATLKQGDALMLTDGRRVEVISTRAGSVIVRTAQARKGTRNFRVWADEIQSKVG
jgi:hypothetical protein